MRVGTRNLRLLAVAMVIETRSFCFFVVNSRFGRFIHGFQETFPHRTRKMLTAYLKFEQQSDLTFFFFCLLNFDLFLLIFKDLKIFFKYY